MMNDVMSAPHPASGHLLPAGGEKGSRHECFAPASAGEKVAEGWMRGVATTRR
jgi:hypothetical protein